MKNKNKDGEIDLKRLLFKFRSKWPYFLASIVVTMAVAFIYNQIAERTYTFNASILLEGQSSGSQQAQELLELLEVKREGINIEDEVGLLTSYATVRKAIERLDFNVSYFTVEKHWLNTFGNIIIKENYTNYPFKIVLDPEANQIVNVPINIKLLSKTRCQLTVNAEKVRVYNFKTSKLIKEIPKVEINKTFNLNEPFKHENLTFKIVLNDSNVPVSDKEKLFFVVNSLTGITGKYKGRVVAKPIERNSRIIQLTSEGTVPEKEIKFLNELMEVFIESDLNEKNQTGEKTLAFIDSQLSEVSDSLRKTENALVNFRQKQNIVDVGIQSNNIFQQLDQLKAERSRLNLSKQYYNNALAYLRNGASGSPSTLGIEDAIISNALNELSSLNSQKAAISATIKQDNPISSALDEKIKSTMNTLTENIVNNINNIDISLRDVNRRIAGLEGNIYALPKSQMQLTDLVGKTEFNDKTYDFLLEKRAEAAIALATNIPDKKIVDYAKPTGDGPTYPKTKQIYIIAFLVGLILPALGLIALDYIDDTIKSKEDLEKITNIPFLGVITSAGKNTKIALVEKPKSAISESFRSVRVNLQYLAVGMNKKVIGVTSSIPGEGKTFCSVNISAELALSGKRTLLIEADLRRPTVNKYMNVSNKVGLSSYLIKSNTLEEVIQHTKIKNLDVIVSGPIPPNPIELVGVQEMDDLMRQMREKYDYVILDIPPIGLVSEYFILLKHIDANLFVVRHKYTTQNVLEQINELYNNKKVNHLYMVLNDVDYNTSYEYEYKTKANNYYV